MPPRPRDSVSRYFASNFKKPRNLVRGSLSSQSPKIQAEEVQHVFIADFAPFPALPFSVRNLYGQSLLVGKSNFIVKIGYVN